MKAILIFFFSQGVPNEGENEQLGLSGNIFKIQDQEGQTVMDRQ